MREISVDSLQSGMRFTEPLYMDDSNIILFAGLSLRQSDIDKLVSLNVSHVKTKGDLLKKKGRFHEMVLMAFSSQEQREATRLYTQYVQQYTDVLRAIEEESPLSSDTVTDIVNEIIELLADHKETTIQYILYGRQGRSDESEDALNASIISILIGQELNFSAEQIQTLGASALLRDCGMTLIPLHIREKTGKLNGEELEYIQLHPVHSHSIITRRIGFSSDVGVPALQHQECWNGQGYPNGLKGTEISLHARIIAVADAFEAMISTRVYRNAMTGYTAMRTILKDNGRRFDPEILRVFIRTLGIYPVGSIVQLSNSAIARVLRHVPEAVLRPVVKIMINAEGITHYQDDGEVMDMEEARDIFIVKAVNPQTVQKTNQKTNS